MRYSPLRFLVALSLAVAFSPTFVQPLFASEPEPGNISRKNRGNPAMLRRLRLHPGAGRGAALKPTTQYQRSHDALSPLSRAPSVGLVTGELNGTYLQIGSDLSSVVTSDALRVMPLMGRGSLQNLGDLLYFHGVDLALLAADSVRSAENNNTYPGFRSRVRYLTKLYDEEIHVLAGADVQSMADLAGKTVNVGELGSGASVTGPMLFEMLNLSVNTNSDRSDIALEKLKRGEIAAMVYVSGKPVQLLATLPANSKLHLVPLPMSEALLNTYVPATLTHADYPTLTNEGETVETLAVPVLLTAYNWPAGTPQYRNLAAFTGAFFSHLSELLQAPYHEKWHEVNLRARVPGWTRAPYAQQWLDRMPGNAPTSQVPVAAGFEQEEFAEWTGSIGLTNLTAVQKGELLRLWKTRRDQAQPLAAQ